MNTDFKQKVVDDLRQMQSSVRMVGRLEAFRQVYEKTDRILSGRPVRVQMSFAPSAGLETAPGWTDGEDITLNANVINRDLGNLPMPMIVLHTKAVNYHELGHIMFSPRMSDDLPKYVKANQLQEVNRPWWYAYNALEDQRMEMMFVAKFRPSAMYFEAIALKWLVNNTAFLAESYILVYGRKFLPTATIAMARAAYVVRYGEAMAVRLEAIIDKYVSAVLPSATLIAQSAVQRFVHLLEDMRKMHAFAAAPTPSLVSADNGGTTGPSKDDPTAIRKGSAKVKDQKDAADGMDNVQPRKASTKPEATENDDTDDADDADGGDDIPGDDGEGQGGAGGGDQADDTDDGDSEGEDSNVGSTAGDFISGQSSASSDGDASGQGAGNDPTPATGTEPTIDEITEAIYEALDELFANEDFVNELNETASAVQALMNGEGVAVGIDTPSVMRSVRPEVVSASRRMAQVLTRLRTELEETRLLRQNAGTIDVRRFNNRKPWEMDFYQAWDPGMDEETDLEAVIIVDLSGSMQSVMRETSEALWAVKRSLQALDSRVTVLGFSEASFVLYQPTEKVEATQMRLFGHRTATIPDGALKEAHRLLTTSTRSQKLLVSITDGDWQGNRKAQDGYVTDMNNNGVVTACIGIAGVRPDHHCHQVYHELSDIRQMPQVATSIVAESLKKLSAGMHQHV